LYESKLNPNYIIGPTFVNFVHFRPHFFEILKMVLIFVNWGQFGPFYRHDLDC